MKTNSDRSPFASLPIFALGSALIFALGACSSPSPTPLAAPPARPSINAVSPPTSGPNSATDSPTTDPAGSRCALVTVAQVTTAAGQPMKTIGDDGAGGICLFSAVADPSFVMYLRFMDSDADITAAKAQLESLSVHLAGMGDDAYWNATLGEVFVQKGSRAFRFDLPSFANMTSTPAAVKGRMITLATAVLARF